jgi:hypothetical protein
MTYIDKLFQRFDKNHSDHLEEPQIFSMLFWIEENCKSGVKITQA